MGAEQMGRGQACKYAVECAAGGIGFTDDIAVVAMDVVRVRCVFVPWSHDHGLVVAGI